MERDDPADAAAGDYIEGLRAIDVGPLIERSGLYPPVPATQHGSGSFDRNISNSDGVLRPGAG